MVSDHTSDKGIDILPLFFWNDQKTSLVFIELNFVITFLRVLDFVVRYKYICMYVPVFHLIYIKEFLVILLLLFCKLKQV